MSTNLRPGVLFDVDGTLLDTNYLHTLAWARALHDCGEWAPMNAIHRLIGMGGDRLVPELLGHENPLVAAARGERFQELIDEVHPFPGAAELLRRTHDAGIVVVLATSAPADELGQMLPRLGAEEAIDAWTTADDVRGSKPDPEVLLTARRASHIDPDRVVVVGDSIWDVRAAAAAGMACLTVETGGFSQHELDEAGAVHVYRDVGELLAQFDTSRLATLAR